MSDKKAVVSFADGVGNYAKALMRLEQSLKQTKFDGQFMGINDYGHIKSPLHKGGEHNTNYVPYAFKPHSIIKAAEEGARYILWLDSVVFATKSIEPVFDHIKEHGYLFFDNIGFSIGDYTSDRCLEYFGISREDSYKIPMLMCCVMGFDIKNPVVFEFFNQYMQACKDGIYNGSWTNANQEVSNDMRCFGHRHDQSAASCIVHNMGLKITNAQETYFAYVEHKGKLKISETVCLWSQGM